MLKRLFLIISLLCLGMGMQAQHTPGTWSVLPMSATDFQQVVDTPDFVYYLTGNSLYSYDKANDETTFYAPGSKLSDSGVASIKYNPAGKYLLCVYSNANIDLIYDDGRIINLPEIKDANLTTQKNIREVNFGDGRFYVATDFGLVVYDDKNHVVLESGIYNQPVLRVLEMGDKILILTKNPALSADTPEQLGYALKQGRHNTLDKFTFLRDVGVDDWLCVDANKYISILNGEVWRVEIDFDNASLGFYNIASAKGGKNVIAYKNGFYVPGSSAVYEFDGTTALTATTTLPDGLGSGPVAMWESPKSVWSATDDGIGNFDISSATPTVLRDRYFPSASKQFNNAYAVQGADGKVYFNGIGQSAYHPAGDEGWGMQFPYLLESYDWATGEILPHYPVITKQYSAESQAEQNKFKLDLLFGGPGRTALDPVDSDIVYMCNNFDGLFVIDKTERKILAHFDKTNSPLYCSWGTRVYEAVFDPFGNLWVGTWRTNQQVATSTLSPVKVILKESLDLARANGFDILSEKDASGQYKHWAQPRWPDNDAGAYDFKLVFSGKKGLRISGNWEGPIVGFDTNGTSEVSDDVATFYNGFLDQDGASNNPTHKGSMVVDKNGHIWIGTSVGVYIVKDLSQLGNGANTISAIRPKVARNDGTNYADYLLGTDEVVCMAVDGNNRKWLGTVNSGLFYVSADGTEVLSEFNTDNSPLTTNTITMVACNPDGNDVLIGTPDGLYVYSSDSTPAAEDYSEIYAYPNPVRPDYSGWITITGLMDNSLVKIADPQGAVVWTGRAEGGMTTWDGCDAAGNRVRSGVYMVYASQSGDSGSKGAVTKIVVIN